MELLLLSLLIPSTSSLYAAAVVGHILFAGSRAKYQINVLKNIFAHLQTSFWNISQGLEEVNLERKMFKCFCMMTVISVYPNSKLD